MNSNHHSSSDDPTKQIPFHVGKVVRAPFESYDDGHLFFCRHGDLVIDRMNTHKPQTHPSIQFVDK